MSKLTLTTPKRILFVITLVFLLVSATLNWHSFAAQSPFSTVASFTTKLKSVVARASAVTIAAPPVLASISVTSTADGAATPANCPGAGCRLRDAIAAAASGDTITFAVTGTITLASELAIDKNLTIQGPGANLLTISGNNAVRVFDIGNVTPAINVTLTGLTVANGLNGIIGGGIVNFSTGTVNVTNSTLSGNSAGGGGCWRRYL